MLLPRDRQSYHRVSEILARCETVGTRTYGPGERRRDELESAWLAAHRDRYIGLWIALEGDELVASAPTARENLATAGKTRHRRGGPVCG